MDGLLIDSESLYQKSRTLAAEDFGFSIEPEFYFDRLAGKHLGDCRDLILEKAGAEIDFTSFTRRSMQYVEELSTIKGFDVKPGVVEILEYVTSIGRCAVASGSNSSHVIATLNQTGLAQHFDIVVTRDDVDEGKPSPELFLKSAWLVGIEPNRCMVFEDSNSGVLAARNARMEVVMVPDVQMPDDTSKNIATAILSQIDLARSIVETFVYPRIKGSAV